MGNIDVFIDCVEPVAANYTRYRNEPDLAPLWFSQRVMLGAVNLGMGHQAPRSRAVLRVILERIAADNCRSNQSR